MYDTILDELAAEGNAANASLLARFFKTGPGQYGEGDAFLGIKVPPIRRIAKQYKDLPVSEVQKLLDSKWHEARLLGAIILSNQSMKGDDAKKQAVFEYYLANTRAINNWDIVDLSCREAVGGYLLLHPEKQYILEDLARSENVWERRIAMVSTWQFIRERKLDQTFTVATILLHDKHDLIHKAVGWMLREAGKRDEPRLKEYLKKHHRVMPRTAFRYAIERLSPEERRYFMSLR